MVDTWDSLCKGCLRCVQECKKGILSRVVNPAYARMGDAYWTPDLISSIWKQAESGKIPVSGAGYRGAFAGPGFDRMWTDMSEIVRPTRDGIHGREYISTLVELGRKLTRLEFGPDGALTSQPPRTKAISVPVILDQPTKGIMTEAVRLGAARAANLLETLAVVDPSELDGLVGEFKDNLIVRFDPDRDEAKILDELGFIELPQTDKTEAWIADLNRTYPDLIVSVRLVLDQAAPETAVRLAQAGAGVLTLAAEDNGRGSDRTAGDFITDLIRRVHLALVAEGLREKLSLIASGGIALAEHVAKIIICGADAAAVDLAWMAALECRLCGGCDRADLCPANIPVVEAGWAAQRIVNLIGSWHSQLIEVMGAMGLREIRRLRGEVGRAMFFDDLEKDSFEPIFGERLTEFDDRPVDGAYTYDRVELDSETVCPSRFRNPLAKYKVVRTTACTTCGACMEVCPQGVHAMSGLHMAAPKSNSCIGVEACRAQGQCCVDVCPTGALGVGPDKQWETLGDPRWPADLLVGTWLQAETGRPPVDSGLDYNQGRSGGGFDRIDLVLPPAQANAQGDEAIDLSIPLNRRDDARHKITIDFPIYGGGMSFGSISEATMRSRARAYKHFNSFTCTGEGGFPDSLAPYADNVITQVATGLFGVREETIQRVRIVEFKYAQGAKPGLGGHLLGDKVTPAVARMREAVVGKPLFSPFPFHSVYSVEDHKKHVDWIKSINPKALVSVKVSTPTDVDMVAVGSYYAGAHIIHIDGSYGGTGAAPDIAKKNIAMPIEYAIPRVHKFLVEEGVRDQVTLIASGGLRSALDAAKAICLGADGVVIGTAELIALECVRCANCESGRGCPRGIATTDSDLAAMYDDDWGSQRIINMFNSWILQLKDIVRRAGLTNVRDLVGRTDLLRRRDYAPKA